MQTKKYVDYMVKQTVDILGIDSPTGFTSKAAQHLMKEYESLGYKPVMTTKGGILVDLGGKNQDDALLIEAHMDTLGGMVCQIKSMEILPSLHWAVCRQTMARQKTAASTLETARYTKVPSSSTMHLFM